MKVRIKTWAEMEEEFGLDSFSYIGCRCTFTKEMEKMIPVDRIIQIKKGKYASEWEGFSISEDMIAEHIGETVKPEYLGKTAFSRLSVTKKKRTHTRNYKLKY